MPLYAGLDPQAALAKWYAIRQKPESQLTPEEKADIAENMVGLSEQNPAAWKLVATGMNDNGKTKQVFDTTTGQWKDQEDKGLWSHPESWLQLAAAGSVAAPFALGALGAGAGAGGGSTAGGVGVGETAATTGMGSGIAGMAPVAAPTVPGMVTGGSKLASLIGGIGKIGGALSKAGVDANGNPVNAPQTSADAARAQALTNNRFLQTSLDQRGPAADAEAQRNMLRAGLISRMDPNAKALSVGPYALPNLAPTSAGVGFSQSLQDKLAARMAAGKSLTLSGVPDPTQEELDAQKAALDATGTGGGVTGGLTKAGNIINQGVGLANLGKGIYDTVRGFF